ncbi:hypothetical protein HG15A2_45950 [Adhaeretor mobilis]|uniref:Uncharacterized protein n=1 Tax=Adhaeretor mobilis TaxID=1930276 RepID=A0A517N299_9BACT|nr:hypothetical protein HG15A2_45950 [Adhaeretor mobilis]
MIPILATHGSRVGDGLAQITLVASRKLKALAAIHPSAAGKSAHRIRRISIAWDIEQTQARSAALKSANLIHLKLRSGHSLNDSCGIDMGRERSAAEQPMWVTQGLDKLVPKLIAVWITSASSGGYSCGRSGTTRMTEPKDSV